MDDFIKANICMFDKLYFVRGTSLTFCVMKVFILCFQPTGANKLLKVWAPTSWPKCPTPLDVQFHFAQFVKSDYNRMEQFSIGEQ